MYKDAPKTTHTSSASVLVTKEEAGILFLANGINFIDKDDARGIFLSFSK